MATPMSASQLVRVLRDAGLRVVEVPGWRTNNRNHKGAWGPVNGVMLHHTVTKGADSSVALCFKGHASLPGPLCHGVIAKDGTVYLVGNGRANHAGQGDPDVLRAVVNESALPPDNQATRDGNPHFYGFECVNLGDGKDPWPKVQVDAMVKASAAICKHHGWSSRSVIGHLEWQPGKIDPRGPGWPGMDTARTRIKAYILEGFEPPKPVPTPAPKPVPAPAAPPKASSAMDYSQLIRESSLTIPAGESRKVYLDAVDIHDEPNQHGAGGYTMILGARAYHGTVSVWTGVVFQGLSVRIVQELADMTTSVSSFADVPNAAGVTTVPFAGMVPAGRRLHVQIHNPGLAALTVDRVEVRLFSEPRG